MKKALKIFISGILIGGAGLLIFINCRLYHMSEIKPIGRDSVNIDVYRQLTFLKYALNGNADQDMQSLYPEGYVFMNALYGLSWANMLREADPGSALYREGHEEIQEAFNRINSTEGKSIFSEDLPLSYGAFYTGWSSYLLGKKLSLETSANRDTAEVRYFKEQCQNISRAIQSRTYPASYFGGVWPADVMLCVASLTIHDKLFTPKYQSDISGWVTAIKRTLDSNGLIAHSIQFKNQKVDEMARGSSQSLMLIFLREIDPEFATEQYRIYKEKFVDSKLGLTGIREYPKGDFGIGDIDSGPVLFGMGGAATIVGMQTLSLYGDYEMSERISSTIEGLGFPFNRSGEKFYLSGALPMADAFIVWSYSACEITHHKQPVFTSFHAFSTGIFLVLTAIFWWLWRKKNPA